MWLQFQNFKNSPKKANSKTNYKKLFLRILQNFENLTEFHRISIILQNLQIFFTEFADFFYSFGNAWWDFFCDIFKHRRAGDHLRLSWDFSFFLLKVDLQFVSLLAKVATAFTRSFKAIANRERNKFPKLPTQLLVTINYPNNCRSQNNAQDINKQMRTKQQLYSSHHK